MFSGSLDGFVLEKVTPLAESDRKQPQNVYFTKILKLDSIIVLETVFMELFSVPKGTLHNIYFLMVWLKLLIGI